MSEQATLRIVSGNPNEEEIAALVSVVLSRQSAATNEETRSEWNNPARLVRGPHRFGPGVWTRSTFGNR